MRLKIIPDIVKRQRVVGLGPSASLLDAARLMVDRKVAAMVVFGRHGVLDGIVTERDIVRMAAARRDLAATPVTEAMTPAPETIAPDDSPTLALAMMREGGYRHLPVVEDGEVVAMVSIRDLFAAVQDQLETDIRNRDAFILGGAPEM